MRHNLLYGPRTPIKGKLDPGLTHVCQSTQGSNLIRYGRELILGRESEGGGGEGGGSMPPRKAFLKFFFKRIFYQHLLSSVAVQFLDTFS